MTSNKALRFAFEKILTLALNMIAPQHGSVITDRREMMYITKMLTALDDVGIDGILKEDYDFDFGNLENRFE